MDLHKELVTGLRDVITRVGDIDCIFPEYHGNDELTGIKEQAEFLLDIATTSDLMVYGYHRYNYEAKELKEHEETTMGRRLVIDFAHLIISFEDIFEGYPTNEEIGEKAMEEKILDFQPQRDEVAYA